MSSADSRMQFQFVNKGIDASQALRERVETRLSEAVSKYFQRSSEAFVAMTREGHGFRADVSIHLPSGALLQAHGFGGDAYAAAEGAVERLEKRLRRYKRKLTDHRAGEARSQAASLVVLQGPMTDVDAPDYDEDAEELPGSGDFEPVVVAETTAELPVLTVGMAVHEMDVSHAPWLMFRNAGHGGVNVVYRRPDGHVGWIDPERGPDAKPRDGAR